MCFSKPPLTHSLTHSPTGKCPARVPIDTSGFTNSGTRDLNLTFVCHLMSFDEFEIFTALIAQMFRERYRYYALPPSVRLLFSIFQNY